MNAVRCLECVRMVGVSTRREALRVSVSEDTLSPQTTTVLVKLFSSTFSLVRVQLSLSVWAHVFLLVMCIISHTEIERDKL